VLADFHIPVNDYAEAIVNRTLEVALDACRLNVQGFRIAEEDVGLCPFGDVVHMSQYICPEAHDSVGVEARDELSIHIHRGRTLASVSLCGSAQLALNGGLALRHTSVMGVSFSILALIL